MKATKVAVYIRLSMADEDTGVSKAESDSVQHQRMLIHDFLNRHAELKDAPRQEFVDDGYTGTNTDRPGFQAAMKALRSGELNVLVTKDFSRAMRDYTEMGNYLECVFPFLGVRYISINDGYDSDDYKGVTAGLDVVLRNIVYASYSKDLSVKTTTAKLQMMKQGKYVGSYAPYGFRFHPEVRNRLAIDPEAAEVVRRIFGLAIEGKKASEIARLLNQEGIPTPGSYFRQRHPGNGKFRKRNEANGWTHQAVLVILKQYEYTGATVGHKRSKAGLTTKKTNPNDKSDWIIVEGMHEAIVTHEEFEKAQEVIRTPGNCGKRKSHDYPLKGVVRCGECRRTMTRRKGGTGFYYICNKSVQMPDTRCPIGKHFMEAELERVLLDAVQQTLTLFEKKKSGEKELVLTRKSRIKACAAEIASFQQQCERYRQEKLRAYESYAAGNSGKDQYLEQKKELDGKISKAEEGLKVQNTLLAELESQANAPENPLEGLHDAYGGTEKLTHEMVQAFVKEIFIYPDSQVEIVWKFRDFYEAQMMERKDGQE